MTTKKLTYFFTILLLLAECTIIVYACLTRIKPELLTKLIDVIGKSEGIWNSGTFWIEFFKYVIVSCCPACGRYIYQQSQKNKKDKLLLAVMIILCLVSIVVLNDILRAYYISLAMND